MKQGLKMYVFCVTQQHSVKSKQQCRENLKSRNPKRDVYSGLHGFWLVAYSSGRLGVSH